MRRLARKQLDILKENGREGYVSPVGFAQLYTVLGEKDKAFEWLEKACQERSPSWLLFLRADPQFDDLRSDTRFAPLVKRIGSGT